MVWIEKGVSLRGKSNVVGGNRKCGDGRILLSWVVKSFDVENWIEGKRNFNSRTALRFHCRIRS